jgi:hypothetical protein
MINMLVDRTTVLDRQQPYQAVNYQKLNITSTLTVMVMVPYLITVGLTAKFQLNKLPPHLTGMQYQSPPSMTAGAKYHG